MDHIALDINSLVSHVVRLTRYSGQVSAFAPQRDPLIAQLGAKSIVDFSVRPEDASKQLCIIKVESSRIFSAHVDDPLSLAEILNFFLQRRDSIRAPIPDRVVMSLEPMSTMTAPSASFTRSRIL